MKSLLRQTNILSLLIAIIFITTGCGSGSNNTTQPIRPTYSWINGSCHQNNGQVVASNFCGGTQGPLQQNYGNPAQNGYNNGNPYSAIPQQSNQVISQPCYGIFMSFQGQHGYCNGNNCRGYFLISMQTQAQIYCL